MARSDLVILALAPVVLVTSWLVNREVPDPYMDEIFHIPQAQLYCRGDFRSWDSKLTTPPGLYLLSLPLTFFLGCSPAALRFTNALLLLAIPLLVRRLLPSRSTLEALSISTYPVAMFFAFLYYTDLGSLAAVLGCALAAQRERHLLAATLGCASLWFRQTNIVWVAFILAFSLLSLLSGASKASPSGAVVHLQPASQSPLTHLPAILVSLVRVALQRWREVLLLVLPYLFVFASFGAFIIWNGGIVLGDKSNHVATLHLTQPLYFVAASTAFALPSLVVGGGIRWILRTLKHATGSFSRFFLSFLLTSIASYTIRHYSLAHPFLLSDNRHYAFYLYRRILNNPRLPYLRYALAPLYTACAWIWWDRLSPRQPALIIVLFALCTSAVLVPSPLIEPRYFIVPHVLLRLLAAGRRPPRRTAALAEIAVNVLVNAVTIAVFLRVKFRWESEEGWQRFMW